jgi:hypothetical protein
MTTKITPQSGDPIDPADIMVSLDALLDDSGEASPPPQDTTPQDMEPQDVAPQDVAPQDVAPQENPPAPGLEVPADVLAAHTTPPASDDPDEGEDHEPPAAVKNDRSANEAFARLRADLKKQKALVREKDAEIARLTTAQTPELEEVQALRNQLEEAERQLGQYDLSSTKAFKERFDAPMDDILRKGVSLLVRSGKDAEAANRLVQELASASGSIADMQELLVDEPFAVQGALTALFNDYTDLQEARQTALSEWEETQAALGAQERRQSEIQLMENVERGTEEALQEVLKAGNWMYARSSDNAQWNAMVDQRIKTAKGLLRSGKPEELISMVMEGVTAKETRELALAAQQQINDLQAQLQELVQATPGMHRHPGPPGRTPPPPDTPRTTEALLDEILR